jgi:thiamine-monophosphate kinase
MKLSDIGEFGLIERFSKKYFSESLPSGYVGIGDDCAVIPFNKGGEMLVSTDLLVENVHFIRSEIGGMLLGRKSLAVNLSDLASSGAKPCASFLSIAVPDDTDVEFLDSFFKGYSDLSSEYGCPLLGGDTTKSPEFLTINVTVIGTSEHRKLRSMAKPGDIICVTGFLGDSAAGLDFVKNPSKKRDKNAEYFISRHHSPVPRVGEGRFLASFDGVHAMMDISDGISSDLKHIMKASNVSAVIELEKLPLSPLMTEFYSLRDAYSFATTGGEDYELLLTVDSKKIAEISEKFEKCFSKPLYQIGKITEGYSSEIVFLENSFPLNGFSNGFDHFTC